MLVNHLEQLIFEGESLDFLLLSVFVRRSFDVFLDAMNFFVSVVILIKELGKVVVVHLEVMDGVFVLGEFVEEVVFFDGHSCFWVSMMRT